MHMVPLLVKPHWSQYCSPHRQMFPPAFSPGVRGAQAALTVAGQGLRDPKRFCSVWLEEPTGMERAEALVLDAVSPTALLLR